jgi:hypothetical protein
MWQKWGRMKRSREVGEKRGFRDYRELCIEAGGGLERETGIKEKQEVRFSSFFCLKYKLGPL